MQPTELSSGSLAVGNSNVVHDGRAIVTGLDLLAGSAAATAKVYDGNVSGTLIAQAGADTASGGDHVDCNVRVASSVTNICVVVTGTGATAVLRYK